MVYGLSVSFSEVYGYIAGASWSVVIDGTTKAVDSPVARSSVGSSIYEVKGDATVLQHGLVTSYQGVTVTGNVQW